MDNETTTNAPMTVQVQDWTTDLTTVADGYFPQDGHVPADWERDRAGYYEGVRARYGKETLVAAAANLDETYKAEVERHRETVAKRTELNQANVSLRRQVEVMRHLVAATVAEMGRDNDYCNEQMTEFLARALDMSESDAADLLRSHQQRTYRIEVEVRINGSNEHTTITHREWRDFLAEVLDVDGDIDVLDDSVMEVD